MANLKEIRGRITSISSTRQITSAMKMVSAAKLRRAQEAITQMRPYANKLKELLGNLSESTDDSQSPFTEERVVEKLLIVPITSNRGLAGAFNSNIIKETNRLIKEEYAAKDITVMAIGKKADDYFKKTDYNIKGTTLPGKLDQIFDDLTFERVADVAKRIMDSFSYKQFDKVVLVYNEFVNAAVQNVNVEQMLPILAEENTDAESSKSDYIYEPSREFIIAELIPKSLKLQLYKAILDSQAAEHGARMTAMHKATDNATELIGDLKLVYNKARQASITNEILEIVGGAEALNN